MRAPTRCLESPLLGKSGTDGTFSAFERCMISFDESPEIDEHPDANRSSAWN